MAIKRAILLIADIGGYTRFMRVHSINLAHAHDIITRLLEAVIDGAGSAFKLAKLEGDAAFFHAPLRDAPAPGELEHVLDTVHAIRNAFIEQRDRMNIDRLCTCDGCTQIGELKIKFVANVGEIAYHKVKGRMELAGVPVIVLHRLLKNSVPIAEYALMTGPILDGAKSELRKTAQQIEEDLEGLGASTVYYVDLVKTAPPVPPPAPAGYLTRLWRHILFNIRSFPYMIGLRQACDGFRNMDEALGRPALGPAKPDASADGKNELPSP
ncbi:MAG TPA: DUF2652 domain-containing protein [Polyangium sp.]|jgi:hypothetical protein|nr:DUF2652 domain-containing protein [Polyangium sp.]